MHVRLYPSVSLLRKYGTYPSLSSLRKYKQVCKGKVAKGVFYPEERGKSNVLARTPRSGVKLRSVYGIYPEERGKCTCDPRSGRNGLLGPKRGVKVQEACTSVFGVKTPNETSS